MLKRSHFNRAVLLAAMFLLLNTAHAKNPFNKDFFFSPGVSVGYTFGAKINYGFLVDFGLVEHVSDKMDIRYGFSFYQYYVKTEKHIHRLRSFSIMGQTDFVDIKVGIGRARNKWGNKNRCIVRGISYDISFAYPDKYSPWIGFRRFRYPSYNWAWFMTPYNSIYIKYKYDIIQNTELKNTVKFN